MSTVAEAAVGKLWRLPARRNRVKVERAVKVPMRDGVTLLADHYIPVTDSPMPTILVRCPYGRGFPYSLMSAQLFASRGYHVLFQSTRGTYGSGGTFVPAVSEPADAQDTVAWLREQEWFDGRLATAGGSYLGYTQWALAMDPPPELTAMVVMVGVHDISLAAYQQGPMDLYNALSWSDLLSHQETVSPAVGLIRTFLAERRLAGALKRLPLRGTVDGLGGAGAPWYDDWVDHPDRTDSYWDSFRVTDALHRVEVPTLLIGGWHDYFIQQTLAQYDALRARNVQVAVTIGPWTHLTVDNKIAMPQAISWLDEHAAGRAPVHRAAPVQVFVSGQWQNHQTWPPADMRTETWYLQSDNRLAGSVSTEESSGTGFRYDPENPTPSVGGRVMALSGGAKDNRKLEARDDVVVFTTEPLAEAVEVHGEPVVELHVTSDNANADLFARICDVDPSGRSVNVTDRIVRCTERDTVAGEVRTVRMTLDPTAHRFEPGHRIRLQISGGAFPRFARNLGTGENPGTGTAMKAASHVIQHDATQPSRISLPRRLNRSR
ncbi:CocE/NonD family hydrolase [Kibdelosporangium philippinense]|uniref:CocE/NonD family hydrolase n=1 Tax=Kibdelosporangium philippinense TaxID=211113 RepID=A0ABS8ZR49_9PSEU|nr:CocE/NonD family hydrolase [Kibdelosporangium philippinense]MCE7010190.1 CocE/NonD family hydrolase [Kibdelosporangium philippinense]